MGLSTYHIVCLDHDTDNIKVQSLGKYTTTRSYKLFKDLPKELRGKIATLNMMDVDYRSHVAGLGYVLDKDTFWIED